MSDSPEAPKTLRERFLSLAKPNKDKPATLPKELSDVKLYSDADGCGLEVAGYRLAYDKKRGLAAIHPSGQVHILDQKTVTETRYVRTHFDGSGEFVTEIADSLKLPSIDLLSHQFNKQRAYGDFRAALDRDLETMMPPPRPRKDYFYDKMLASKDRADFIEKLDKGGFRLAYHDKRGLVAVRYTGKVHSIQDEVCRGFAWKKLEPLSSLPTVKKTKEAVAKDVDFWRRSAQAIASARANSHNREREEKERMEMARMGRMPDYEM